MSNTVILDNVTHQNLRVRQAYPEGAGYDLNVARVFPSELADLQRQYPLMLLKNQESGHFETIALLGFQEGENLFLDADGWASECIPLSMQRQPFLIGFQEQEIDGIPGRAPVVCIDMDHPLVNEEEGEPVFLPGGGESPYLQRMASILKAIHEGHEDGERFSQILVGLELVEPVAVDVEFRNAEKTSLKGLFRINEQTFKHLNANALQTLHEQQYLRCIFMLLASLGNMPRLIERKNRQLEHCGAGD